jgi:hypothetical protein
MGGRVFGIVDINRMGWKRISSEIEIGWRFKEKRPIEGDVRLDEKDMGGMAWKRGDAKSRSAPDGRWDFNGGEESAYNKPLDTEKVFDWAWFIWDLEGHPLVAGEADRFCDKVKQSRGQFAQKKMSEGFILTP